MYIRPRQKLVIAITAYSLVDKDSFPLSDGPNANKTSVTSVGMKRNLLGSMHRMRLCNLTAGGFYRTADDTKRDAW